MRLPGKELVPNLSLKACCALPRGVIARTVHSALKMETVVSNRPEFIVYAAFKAEGKEDRLQSVGALWLHDDRDSFNLHHAVATP